MSWNSVDVDLGWIDIALLAMFGLSVLAGLWRGFVFEFISLVGWLAAFVIANSAGPSVAEMMPTEHGTAQMRLWLAYAAVFVAVLVACTLLARLLRAVVSATPLSFVDHLLGAGFGAVRGALVLVVVATLVMLSPWATSEAWRNSHGALWLGMALEGLKPVLPQSLNVRINT